MHALRVKKSVKMHSEIVLSAILVTILLLLKTNKPANQQINRLIL